MRAIICIRFFKKITLFANGTMPTYQYIGFLFDPTPVTNWRNVSGGHFIKHIHAIVNSKTIKRIISAPDF